ncbi:transaldolase [Haematomicrobium sanguinis]|uniref:transaldolase n=1 Tax=Haematomicrobium sanguinis TaxID=479106 RepID=UPI000479854D|nr:transaldolase [Haematomicrobium sanguinis]
MNANTQALSDAGVSIWLDDLSRERIVSGSLKELIDTMNVVGVTTNPSIFAAALKNGEAYESQVQDLAAQGADVDQAVFEITTDDVAQASDLFADVFKATDGLNGRVSIEVSPNLARDTQGTIAEAKRLADKVNRPNALIKIPATQEGLEAITETIAAGISVNVTLIFSLERYREVINAYMLGLEKAREAGEDISKLESVASFFVSRVDTEVDAQLDAINTDQAIALKGKAGLANARLAYQVFEQEFSSERWKDLEASGAKVQRPLWASTGVKDPSLPDTLYVTELVAPNTVNTMPEKTLMAVADHGEIKGNTIAGTYEESQVLINELTELGISYNDVVAKLEDEGIKKFDVSWTELLETVQTALDQAAQKSASASKEA